MKKIEIVNLFCNNLNEAPEWKSHPYSCKYCVYWEYPEECIDRNLEKKEDMFRKKIQWLDRTKKQFGDCGKLIYVDGKCAGYSQYAPAKYLPNANKYGTVVPSKNAIIIACIFIPSVKDRGLGLGSRLLESIISELKTRGIKAVETFARRGSSANPSGPVEFYEKNGFTVYKDDKEFPLLRLKL